MLTFVYLVATLQAGPQTIPSSGAFLTDQLQIGTRLVRSHVRSGFPTQAIVDSTSYTSARTGLPARSSIVGAGVRREMTIKSGAVKDGKRAITIELRVVDKNRGFDEQVVKTIAMPADGGSARIGLTNSKDRLIRIRVADGNVPAADSEYTAYILEVTLGPEGDTKLDLRSGAKAIKLKLP